MAIGVKEIFKRFGFHRAAIEGDIALQNEKHANLRYRYIDMGKYLDQMLPDGRTKNLALTALEEASMWSHKALAEEGELVDPPPQPLSAASYFEANPDVRDATLKTGFRPEFLDQNDR